MADDWQPGDLALCVNTNCEDGLGLPAALRSGGVYTVTRVFMGIGLFHIIETGLALAEVKPQHPKAIGFAARHFRKINPLTDEERREALRDLKLPERVS